MTDITAQDSGPICIHDPFEQTPASQCVICNGKIKVERAAESAKVLRRAKAANGVRPS